MEKNFIKNSNGLSTVVATVILILLVIVATTIVWGVVNNLVNERTKGVTSCFDAGFSESISLNRDYTCHDFENNETQFSVSIGDIEVEEVLVSISYSGTSKSFTLTKENQTIDGLVTYSSRDDQIVMPNRSSGLTYIATDINAQPDWIRISPRVDGEQCDVTDTIYGPEDCALFE